MKSTLIALTAAAGFAAAALAIAPAAAAPAAPAPLGLAINTAGNQVEQVNHVRRHVRREVRRDVRRHVRRDVRRHVAHPRPHLRRQFWAAGPWAFRGVPPYNCFSIGRGFVCYY